MTSGSLLGDRCIAVALFVAVGIYVNLIYHLWFRYLVKLAGRYDIETRNKRAGRASSYAVVILAVPTMAAILMVVFLDLVEPLLSALMAVLALGPALFFWFRRFPRLRELGYRQPGDKTEGRK